MINLIPQQEKVAIKKEYRLRRFVVVLGLLLALVVIADVLFFPSFIWQYYRLQNVQKSIDIKPTADQTTARTNLLNQIQKYTKILTIMKSAQKASLQPTDIISVIVKDKTNSNLINAFVYTPSADGQTYQVMVNGIAKDRESLQTFVTALKNESIISNVNLPISNFAQDSSINFSFTISGKTTSS